jgi:hypothetical protein
MRVGDLIVLDTREWADDWRGKVGIVVEVYPPIRHKGKTTDGRVVLHRWVAVVDGVKVVVSDEDVTVVQRRNSEE